MACNKKFCSKHSFYFRSVECPFCLKERISKFIPKEEVAIEDRPATEVEINALIEKYKHV